MRDLSLSLSLASLQWLEINDPSLQSFTIIFVIIFQHTENYLVR